MTLIPKPASLDDRLKDVTHVKDLVLQILNSIQDNAKLCESKLLDILVYSNCHSIASGLLRHRVGSPIPDKEGSILTTLESQRHSQIQNALQRSIDRLERLGIAIRRPSTTGLQQGVSFEELSSQMVKSMYPDADDELVSYLGRSMLRRHTKLRHKREHQNEPAHPMSKGVTTYPKPPAKEAAPGFKRCNWCLANYSTAQFEDGRWWRRHVDNDLLPYLCLSEECAETMRQFGDFEQWRTHMEESHTAQWAEKVYARAWVCDINHGTPLHFKSHRLIKSHMLESHRDKLNGVQIRVLAEQSAKQKPRQAGICPLCCSMIVSDSRDTTKTRGNKPTLSDMQEQDATSPRSAGEKKLEPKHPSQESLPAASSPVDDESGELTVALSKRTLDRAMRARYIATVHKHSMHGLKDFTVASPERTSSTLRSSIKKSPERKLDELERFILATPEQTPGKLGDSTTSSPERNQDKLKESTMVLPQQAPNKLKDSTAASPERTPCGLKIARHVAKHLLELSFLSLSLYKQENTRLKEGHNFRQQSAPSAEINSENGSGVNETGYSKGHSPSILAYIDGVNAGQAPISTLRQQSQNIASSLAARGEKVLREVHDASVKLSTVKEIEEDPVIVTQSRGGIIRELGRHQET
ncbi:uncharacterized protein F4822DRAFT_446147 [Hypoxylon trugodes]|uniref:uncharacterized protein n=1 Tax=Hypoxylon trugodes TaxID=326681 RepID=UPI00218CD510|nr:uncharacterized protein F4822DRAFT_446147 [Hypoxylon trugodes]KAI1385112.1 hypothetical protein F4822DRAFT_446147 [Hypoxylon trugodes]